CATAAPRQSRLRATGRRSVPNPRRRRIEPARRLGERFTCEPSAKITTRGTPTQCRATPARLQSGCTRSDTARGSARAGEPRSTPERACFTTLPEATLTCAARDVTLYL